MSKAVYIGAGDDNKFLDRVDFQTLIAVDSQPRSEFGNLVLNGYQRPYFIDWLFDSYKKKNFFATENNRNRIVFQNGSKKVIYYHSFAFPNDINNQFIKDILNYNIIICDGFIPDKKILDYSNKKITFLGTNKTIYLCNEESSEDEIKNNLDFELDNNNSKIDKWIRFDSEWDEEKVNYEIYDFKYLTSMKDFCAL
jgi:hypothetical protein